MNKVQRSALRRFRRVQDFLARNPAVGSAEELGKQSQVLDEVLKKLTQTGEEQDASLRFSRAETTRQRAFRDAVRYAHMVPISRIARLVYGVPGMDSAFFMPKKRADNDSLLDAARGMLQAASKQPDVFVEHGLPKNFVEQFRAATSALSDALGARVDSQRRRTIANQTVVQLVKRGTTAVQMLDAIVAPRLARDPELLASWKSVKRPIEPGGASSAGAGEEVIGPVVKVA